MERRAINSHRFTGACARGLSLAVLLGIFVASPALAFLPRIEPEETPDEDLNAEEVIDDVTQPFPDPDEGEGLPEPAEPEIHPEDECDGLLENQPLQEQSQEVIRSWSCHTFRWFDHWWGDEVDYPEDDVAGWITLGTEYRKYDGFDPRFRIRVRAPLPNLNKRWDLILGRVDEEAFVSGTEAQDETFYNPGAVGRGLEAEEAGD